MLTALITFLKPITNFRITQTHKTVNPHQIGNSFYAITEKTQTTVLNTLL